ncbi:methylated-DNA--[protein]-cysteine S-methyltransferase [Neobacillus mesonae]|uniref:methylated-DNA--[protein]-cysteine S-methyltransferase n=1 Tax=Neobacillus mesonae TaxID=1193713 RepID=UPI00203FFD8A|nr:methylated-DNA--[protein]-cysteine S-methyltransferase [Neobacillus mesonae]MCM3571213.1 methylated-DNA--[protein]-cysteine S-methyltransferase [Neobacillus mesonae]
MKEHAAELIYWTRIIHNKWKMYMAATSKGLVYVGPHETPFEELALWAGKHFPGSPLVEDNEILKPYANEVMDYLDGTRTVFTIPLEYHGTPFQQKVWQALCDIPYGETKSYSDIANSINKPSAVRAVGTAIGANPILITVPCHRVLGKNGSLTGYRGGLEMKTRLLALEKRDL